MMTPLHQMEEALQAGTADRIARAAVALSAIRTGDMETAAASDLERLLMECRVTANLIRLELVDRQREGAQAPSSRPLDQGGATVSVLRPR